MDKWTELVELAARQHGVVSRADAWCCGIADSLLGRRARREGWMRLFPGVWALPGPASPLRESAGALLAVGPSAALARQSAAWLWGLRDGAPWCPEVIAADRHHGALRRGLVVLPGRTLRDGDLRTRVGLRVTSPARTLADMAKVAPPERLTEMATRALQRGLLGEGELDAQLARLRGPAQARLREAVGALQDYEHEAQPHEHDEWHDEDIAAWLAC